MYKIVQNFNTSDDYEYVFDYKTISEAEKTVQEYYEDDKKEGVYHSYTIVNEDYEDIEVLYSEEFQKLALLTMQDIGLTKDEAVNVLEDYQLTNTV